MAHFALQFGRTEPHKTYAERPSVYGICVRQDNRIAIVKIGAEAPFKYDLPGGGVESGEGDAEALIREFEEETGLTVWPNRSLGRAGQFWINDGRPTNSLSTFFEVELTATDGTPSEPDHALVWLTLEDALGRVRHDSHAWFLLSWSRERRRQDGRLG